MKIVLEVLLVQKVDGGNRRVVTMVDGEVSSSRVVTQKDWFDSVAPIMRKTSLLAEENVAKGWSVWKVRA